MIITLGLSDCCQPPPLPLSQCRFQRASLPFPGWSCLDSTSDIYPPPCCDDRYLTYTRETAERMRSYDYGNVLLYDTMRRSTGVQSYYKWSAARTVTTTNDVAYPVDFLFNQDFNDDGSIGAALLTDWMGVHTPQGDEIMAPDWFTRFTTFGPNFIATMTVLTLNATEYEWEASVLWMSNPVDPAAGTMFIYNFYSHETLTNLYPRTDFDAKLTILRAALSIDDIRTKYAASLVDPGKLYLGTTYGINVDGDIGHIDHYANAPEVATNVDRTENGSPVFYQIYGEVRNGENIFVVWSNYAWPESLSTWAMPTYDITCIDGLDFFAAQYSLCPITPNTDYKLITDPYTECFDLENEPVDVCTNFNSGSDTEIEMTADIDEAQSYEPGTC